MVWSHPEIALEDLLSLIKGFVDILVLASGYQTSGRPAVWDVDNIKKALQWGLFFEEVLRRLLYSDHYEDSLKELDAALCDLTSLPSFPKGLMNLSSVSLLKARDLVLRHLVQTHPLEVSHLAALFTAVIEMDLEEHNELDNFDPTVYVERLISRIETLTLVPAGKGSLVRPISTSETTGSSFPDGKRNRICKSAESYEESKYNLDFENSCFLIQELLNRLECMSCIASLETALGGISNLMSMENMPIPETGPFGPFGRKLSDATSSGSREIMTDAFLWCKWKSRCLSYLLDQRTIRLLAGAKLIFSAPKVQWSQVFEQLIVSTDPYNEDLLEIMEMLFLGIISRRWNALLEHFMSHSCNYLPVTSQYSDLHNLLQENLQSVDLEVEKLNPTEKDILDYVTKLLGTQSDKLWLLPPVLAAAAIPSWSILFRIYISEIERRCDGSSTKIRCCSCVEDGKEHKDCEVAERIRCLYMFHFLDSSFKADASCALF